MHIKENKQDFEYDQTSIGSRSLKSAGKELTVNVQYGDYTECSLKLGYDADKDLDFVYSSENN